MLPKQGRVASLYKFLLVQIAAMPLPDSVKRTSVRLPYIDINPHKNSPKWLAYVGLLLLLVGTIAFVAVLLTAE